MWYWAPTAIGVGAVVFFFDPRTHGFYPVCLFHALTGLNCPGCGMTRALYALLHGNLRLALKDNALFVVTLAVLAGLGRAFYGPKIEKTAGGIQRAAEIFVGVSPGRVCFRGVEKFAGVCVAFAVRSPEFFAFAAARARVQSSA